MRFDDVEILATNKFCCLRIVPLKEENYLINLVEKIVVFNVIFSLMLMRIVEQYFKQILNNTQILEQFLKMVYLIRLVKNRTIVKHLFGQFVYFDFNLNFLLKLNQNIQL